MRTLAPDIEQYSSSAGNLKTVIYSPRYQSVTKTGEQEIAFHVCEDEVPSAAKEGNTILGTQ